jgi:hypothetical protein
MLKSSETLTWEQALQYDNLEELVQALAEEKVYKLSYKSFAELNKYSRGKRYCSRRRAGYHRN